MKCPYNKIFPRGKRMMGGKRGRKAYANAVYVPVEGLTDISHIEFAIGRLKTLLQKGYEELIIYPLASNFSRSAIIEVCNTYINDEQILAHIKCVSVRPQYESYNRRILSYCDFKEVGIPPEVFLLRIAENKTF